jgi:hypothetical protein
MGSMDFWIIGSSVTLVWNQVLLPFPACLLSLSSFRPLDSALGRPFHPFGGGERVVNRAKNPMKSQRSKEIRLNQTKSDLFFYPVMLTPESFGLRRHVAAFPRRDMSRRSKAQSCLRTPQAPLTGASPVLIRHPIRLSTKTSQPSTNTKITKRTQFKNRTTCPPRQLRRAT